MTFQPIKFLLSAALTAALTAIPALASAASSANQGAVRPPAIKSFTCTSVDENMVIEAFDVVEGAGAGAFVEASGMRVLNPTLEQERRFVAEFRADDGVLSVSDNALVGQVDAEKARLGAPGKRVGGTRLGLLRTISLEIDLSYADRVGGSAVYSGHAIYLKRNGQTFEEDFDCVRHPSPFAARFAELPAEDEFGG